MLKGYKRQRSNTMKFLDVVEKSKSGGITTNPKTTQLTVNEINRRRVVKDLKKLFDGMDFEQEIYKPCISTIHKAFEGLNKLAILGVQEKIYVTFIHDVLKRCVFCKSVDVPQVLIEQIQHNNEESKAKDILKQSEIPYFSINTEFLNCLNVVIENAKNKVKEYTNEITLLK